KGQAVFEEVKSFGQVDQQEKERPEAEYREDVRGINDEAVGGYPEDGRDGVDRKDQVGDIYHHKDEQQKRSGSLAFMHYEELFAVVMLVDADEPGRKADDRAFFRLERLVLTEHFY